MTPAGGLRAGPPLELLARLRDEHLEAADRLAPGGRRLAQQPRRRRVVDQVVDVAGRSARSAVERRRVDARIHADRRAVDQQIPAARLRRPAARRVADASVADLLGLRRDCARARVTRAPLDASATATARAAPPAPSTARAAPASGTRSRSGSRKPADVGVAADPAAVDRRACVLMAPIAARHRVDLVARVEQRAPCSGIVTLAPLHADARARTSRSRRRRRRAAAGRRRRCRPRGTRRCASPARPSARPATRRGRRRRSPS